MAEEYVAYLRVSTDKQGESRLGIEAQEKAILDFIKSKDGHLLSQYIEIESGKKNDRPKLAEAIAYSKKNKSTLLIARLDRLARSVSFISKLMDSDVRFVACDMPAATDFMLHIYAAVAEEERRMISKRTKDALAVAKAQGTTLGANGRVLAEHNKRIAAEYAQKIWPTIQDIKSRGITSIRGISDALNTMGIPSPHNGKWHTASVHRIIRTINSN